MSSNNKDNQYGFLPSHCYINNNKEQYGFYGLEKENSSYQENISIYSNGSFLENIQDDGVFNVYDLKAYVNVFLKALFFVITFLFLKDKKELYNVV